MADRVRAGRRAARGSLPRRAGIGAGLLAAAFLLPAALAAPQATPDSGFGDIQPVEQPTPLPTLPPLPPLDDGASQPATAEPPGTGTRTASPVPLETPAAPAARPPGLGVSPQVLVLLGVGVLVVVATIIVVLAVVLKAPVVINVMSRSAAATYGADGPEPAEWIEGDLVRMGRPPEGTLKILPGRFILESGDRPVEIRIFRTTGDTRVETTIGRDPGPAYRHIQLKPFSVSGKHAKLVYEHGFYSIVNYSRTNPTSVNAEALPEGASRRLVDEDRLEIGEVLLTYHET